MKQQRTAPTTAAAWRLDPRMRDRPRELASGVLLPSRTAWHKRFPVNTVDLAPDRQPVGDTVRSERIRRALQQFDEVLLNSIPDFQLDSSAYAAWQTTALQRTLNRVESRNRKLEQENTMLRSIVKAAAHIDPEGLKRQFTALAEQWHDETGHMSSAISFTQHPAYLRIIGMGPAVVPFILEDLQRTRAHWFTALRLITGANPIRPEDKGNVQRLADAWIAWGRERGLV